jgi:hypothetical protein
MRPPDHCCCDDPTCPTCATSPGWTAADIEAFEAALAAHGEPAWAVVVADEGGGTAEYPF